MSSHSVVCEFSKENFKFRDRDIFGESATSEFHLEGDLSVLSQYHCVVNFIKKQLFINFELEFFTELILLMMMTKESYD